MSERNHIQTNKFMTDMPVSVGGVATMRKTLNRMYEANICSVKIKQRRTGNELCNRSLGRTNAYEIILKSLLTVHTCMKIKCAIGLFSKFGLSRSLLVDNNEAFDFETFRDWVVRYTDIIDWPQRGAVS